MDIFQMESQRRRVEATGSSVEELFDFTLYN